jgi:hypothetical protein
LSDFKFESPAPKQDRLSDIGFNSRDFDRIPKTPVPPSPASVKPNTPQSTPPPLTPAKSPAATEVTWHTQSTDYSTRPKVTEKEIDYGPLVPIPNQDQYPKRKYYMIRKYKNSFGTEKYLAVAKSILPEGGLGLFAILPIHERKL